MSIRGVIFFISSALLLLSTGMWINVEHDPEWKKYQKKYYEIYTLKTEKEYVASTSEKEKELLGRELAFLKNPVYEVKQILLKGKALWSAGDRRQETGDRGAPLVCPKCGCDDPSMVEVVDGATPRARGFCSTCAADWALGEQGNLSVGAAGSRFASVEDLIARTGLRRDELAILAEIGALNAFGYDRRTALWQIERAVREPGELFKTKETGDRRQEAGGLRRHQNLKGCACRRSSRRPGWRRDGRPRR